MFIPVFGNLFETEWFPAVITGVGAAVTSDDCEGIPHAWSRLTPCRYLQNNKVRAGYPAPSGTVAGAPAFSLDGSAAAVNDLVLMRFNGLPEGKPTYQFLKLTVPVPPAPNPNDFVAAFVPTAKVSPGSKIYIAKIFNWDQSAGTEGNFVDSGITIRAREANGYDFSTGFIYPGIYVGPHGAYKMFTSLQTLGVVIDVACTEGELTQTKRTGIP